MSSEILVYGYLEMPPGAHGANSVKIAALCRRDDAASTRLMLAIKDALRRTTGTMIPFAECWKKISDDHCDALQRDFEEILRNLSFASAHLSVDDEEGFGCRHIDYAYGPLRRIDGADVITRAVSQRQRGEWQELEAEPI